MTKETAASLASLLSLQNYIHSCEWSNHATGVDLDHWRSRYRHGFNLADLVADAYSAPHSPREIPWLHCGENKVAKVVFARSARYHGDFPYARAVKKYKQDAVFVGTVEEHYMFTNQFGMIPHYPTANYLALAEVINGALMCVMNMSSPRAVAEGLKKFVYVEHAAPHNTHFARWGARYGVDQHELLPDLDQLDSLARANLIPRTEGKTLCLPRRLENLARYSSQCAGLDGVYGELGVYRGGSAAVIADAAPNKVLHLFDTFTGLPAAMPTVPVGSYAASLDEVQGYLSSRRVVYHAGFFPDSGTPDLRFAFFHFDADLYKSTVDCLAYVWPRLCSGGVLVLDDFDAPVTGGVELAVREVGLADLVRKVAPSQAVVTKP